MTHGFGLLRSQIGFEVEGTEKGCLRCGLKVCVWLHSGNCCGRLRTDRGHKKQPSFTFGVGFCGAATGLRNLSASAGVNMKAKMWAGVEGSWGQTKGGWEEAE